MPDTFTRFSAVHPAFCAASNGRIVATFTSAFADGSAQFGDVLFRQTFYLQAASSLA
jgi:hypothetical protein